jgi:hypothetical protein
MRLAGYLDSSWREKTIADECFYLLAHPPIALPGVWTWLSRPLLKGPPDRMLEYRVLR